jgi:hypothetical protein
MDLACPYEGHKRSSLFGLFVSDEAKKKFDNIDSSEADEGSNSSLNVVNVNSRFVICAVADRPQQSTLNVDPRPTHLTLDGQGNKAEQCCRRLTERSKTLTSKTI